MYTVEAVLPTNSKPPRLRFLFFLTGRSLIENGLELSLSSGLANRGHPAKMTDDPLCSAPTDDFMVARGDLGENSYLEWIAQDKVSFNLDLVRVACSGCTEHKRHRGSFSVTC